MNRASRLSSLGALAALAFTGVVFAGDMSISDVAPKNAFFVAGADNATAVMDAFNRTNLRALWDEPATQQWLKDMLKGSTPELTKSLESVGIKMEDMKVPSGAVGVASWLVTPAEGDGAPEPAVLVLADYGEHAEEMSRMITEALEKASDQKKVKLTDKDHDGATIWSVQAEGAEDDAAAEEEDEFADWDQPTGVEGWMGRLTDKPVYFSRSGDYLMLSTHEDALMVGLDRATGTKGATVEESETFAAIRRQIGSHQAYAALLVNPIVEEMKKDLDARGADASELGAMLPIIEALGLGEIQAIGGGIRFDGDAGMVEAPIAVLVPNKRGVVALLDVAGPFDAPPFVGADAAEAMLFRFNFAGLLPLAQQVVASLPPEEGAQAQAMLGMASMTAGPLLANIGPEMYTIKTYERPFNPESEQTLFVLTVKNADAVTQSLGGLQGMLGLESRDFQGNQIWGAPAGMAGAPSIGLGFGRLFVGPTASVENAMRQAGAGDTPKLAGEKRFVESTRHVAGPGMLFTWTDTHKAADWYDWFLKNMDTIIKAQVAQAFGPDEPLDDEERAWRKEAEEEALSQIPAWVKSMPPGSVLKKHMGDTVVEMRSTKDGFEGRMLTLRP